jgi:predicted O-methyltransferase YrrM
MTLSTNIRLGLNKVLECFNLQVSTLTAARLELARLEELAALGLFDKQVYSVLPGMEAFNASPIAEAYARHKPEIERLKSPVNEVSYVHSNEYFSSPDMEVLYLLVRTLAPRRVLEIGSGNSTRITRQAIRDGALETELTAIDPQPRIDITAFVDRLETKRLEQIDRYDLFEVLDAGDFLFIDSSHEVRLGSDVARIFCDIIPRLRPGIVLHFHDIFLPFEYPRIYWKDAAVWGEQYMLHALLQGRPHEIVWPGHYLQRIPRDSPASLPFLCEGIAQSFWFRLT